MLILDTHILLGVIFEQIPVGIGSTTRADLETAWLIDEVAATGEEIIVTKQGQTGGEVRTCGTAA